MAVTYEKSEVDWEAKLDGFGRPSHLEISLAARTGNLPLVRSLQEQGGYLTEHVFLQAMWSGNLELVKWLWETDCPRGKQLMSDAVFIGNPELIQWLRGTNYRMTSCEFMRVAPIGRLDVIEFLWEIGCRPDDRDTTLLLAVANDHFDLVQWLTDKNFPRIEDAISTSVRSRRIKMFKWLWERGYPCNKDDLKDATQEIADWIKANPRD